MMCSLNAAALYRHPLPAVVLPLDDAAAENGASR